MKTSIWLVAGLAYGDEGKGSVVDYLVRKNNARAVVRYNGGAQAGHRVVLPDGREHIFAQFGSGTLVPGVLTHLSRFMLIEPMGMMNEYAHLAELGAEDAFLRTSINAKAPVITPFHIAANRVLEFLRGGQRHGSCGLGIGETMEDVKKFGSEALLTGDLRNVSVLQKKLAGTRERKLAKIKTVLNLSKFSQNLMYQADNMAILENSGTIDWCLERYSEFVLQANIVDWCFLRRILQRGNVVFEGAQGMLLDPQYGVWPHVTKTDITFRNALALLSHAGFGGDIVRVGVVRGYLTRHGAGPFATEDAKLSELLPDATNKENEWQGKFRVGYFDAPLVRGAIGVIGGIDQLAMTNLDRLIEVGLLKDKGEARRFAVEIAEQLGVKPAILSFGPTAEDKELYI